MKNHLKDQTSPYLLQHAENPVEWYPWCEDAFERAKREDKPIFLSVGYSTCHWCHVMAHESFEVSKTKTNDDVMLLLKRAAQICKSTYDKENGGFSRYSTDEVFLVPHFEKMLYDNALLIMAYCKAYEQKKRAI